MRHRALASLCLGLATLVACAHDAPQGDDAIAAVVRDLEIPARFADGEALFDAHCASCHGHRALGTDRGPPLVHIVYEPSHHADIAFVMAVERGVRAHHWGFGDMPPVPDLSRDRLLLVVEYVRFLQREAGIR